MRYAEACEWLGIDPSIELEETSLKKAYRSIVIKEHPDKSSYENATQRFQSIQHAHQYLIKCIYKNRTGPNCWEEDDEKDDDEDIFHEDEDMDDIFSDIFHEIFFDIVFGPDGNMYVRMPSFQRSRGRVRKSRVYNKARRDGYTVPPPSTEPRAKNTFKEAKPPTESRGRAQNIFKEAKNTCEEECNKTKPEVEKDTTNTSEVSENEFSSYIEKQKLKKERDYDDFIDSMYKHAKLKEEARRQQKKREEEKRQVKMLQIKVKCPEDKKPGDILKIRNPHDPGGDKITIVIPDEAKPGKSFMWNVRVVAEEVKKDPDILCCVCSLNITNSLNTNGSTSQISLRSCIHCVCSPSCLSKVQGTCCLVCNTPNPILDSLKHFQFLKELDCLKNEILLSTLLEDYLTYCEYELSNSSSTSGKKKKEEIKAKLDTSSESVLKQIKKHYRKVSLKLHPDKNGEEFRPQFNILTKARDVMIQNEERWKYFDEMLEIMCKADIKFLSNGHSQWVEKYDKKKNEEKQKEGGTAKPHLRLEGGLIFSIPRKPKLFLCSEKQRLVKVCLPLRDKHQFLTYCHEAIIIGYCGTMDEGNEIRLASISKTNCNIIDNEIIVKLFMPEYGIWDIKWYMTIEQGDLIETPFSEYSSIDLRSKCQLDLERRLGSLKETAKSRVAVIQALLRKCRNSVFDNNVQNQGQRQQVEAQFWNLHSAIANGRSLERRLKDAFTQIKKQPTYEYDSLTQVLKEAVEEKTKLDGACQFYVKKDAKKTFKLQIASILETSDAPKWISNVTREEIDGMKGGEANRLYQLLIEGKQSNSLMFDGPTLSAASNRKDLFSSKQCETLRKRAEEVESQSIAEANKLMEETRIKKEEEMKLKEMEEMAKSMPPRGALVKIYGLKTQSDLNGKIATFMGIAPNKRYAIGLYDGREVALKKENFKLWDASGDHHHKNGFMNTYVPIDNHTIEKQNVSTSENSQKSKNVQNERIKTAKADCKPKPEPQAPPVVMRTKRQEIAEKDVFPIVEYVNEPKTILKAPKSPDQKNISNDYKPKLDYKNHCIQMNGQSQGIKTTVDHDNSSSRHTTHISVCPKSPTSNPIAFLKCPKSPKSSPRSFSKLPKSPKSSKSTAISTPDSTSSTHTTPSTTKKDKKIKRCIKGINCQFLHKGPNVCKYYHTPKEIAQVHNMSFIRHRSTPSHHKENNHHDDEVVSDVISQQDVNPSLPTQQHPQPAKNLSSPEDQLLTFLNNHKNSLKCTPAEFHSWLKSEDISNLADLYEAVNDDDYFHSEILRHGVKKFKAMSFKKFVQRSVA